MNAREFLDQLGENYIYFFIYSRIKCFKNENVIMNFYIFRSFLVAFFNFRAIKALVSSDAPAFIKKVMLSSTRLQAINRKIAQQRLEPEIPIFEDRNHLKRQTVEDLKPLYVCPSDFIDEFGKILIKNDFLNEEGGEGDSENIFDEEQESFDMPSHLETSGAAALEKIKNYMKRRFPERLLLCKSLASTSEQVYTSWRSRTRKREAEWGDPEDLGVITNDPRPEEVKIAQVLPQMAVEPKFLISNYFITNLLSISSKLYYSNRPSIQPTQPFSRFNANTAVWSPSERKIFIELYLQNPKNFGRISAHLPYKSCEQCVEFYYRHKKEYRLKQMVASYRKAMVAQRKLILNTSGTSNTTNNSNNSSNNNNSNTVTSNNNNNNTSNILSNMNILPPSSNSNTNLIVDDEPVTNKKKTGRPVGRPKNKDRKE